MKKYIITLQRFIDDHAEQFQITAAGTFSQALDQVINFTSGFGSGQWEVINVKEV